MLRLIVVCLCVTLSFAEDTPFIGCSQNSGTFDFCLRNSIEQAFRRLFLGFYGESYRSPSMNDIIWNATYGDAYLHESFKDIRVRGYEDVRVTFANLDRENGELNFTLYTPSFRVYALESEFIGKVINKDYGGKGALKFKFRKMEQRHRIKYDCKEVDNQKFMEVKDYKIDFSYDKVKLDDVFYYNTNCSKRYHEAANKEFRNFYRSEEFKNNLSKLFKNIAEKFFKKRSLDKFLTDVNSPRSLEIPAEIIDNE